jgi:hypothetical protein
MGLRANNVRRLGEQHFDVLVVGGGINGAVTRRPRGARAKVALVDKGDFAGFTSQQSSNLAWGGIKYMESYEFGLVRKLCVSRNHLHPLLPLDGAGDPLLRDARARASATGCGSSCSARLVLLAHRQLLHEAPAKALARDDRARGADRRARAVATAASSTPTPTCTTTTRASSSASCARARSRLRGGQLRRVARVAFRGTARGSPARATSSTGEASARSARGCS